MQFLPRVWTDFQRGSTRFVPFIKRRSLLFECKPAANQTVFTCPLLKHAQIVEQGGDSRPHAILLRSHKLQLDEVESSVRAIARCGAGTNNIPVDKMTEIGIPVFNTPGANANAVKELVICGLLLASRGIAEGVRHVQEEIIPGEEGDYGRISARIEKDKKMFVGREIAGKTLGVIGLGAIGSRVAEAATALEMNVVVRLSCVMICVMICVIPPPLIMMPPLSPLLSL